MAVKELHPHYHKNVTHLEHIDVYRVLERYDVTDPALQHAIKKLLAAGGRGAGKTQDQDVQEAIDSLLRFQEMRVEDAREQHDKAAEALHGPVTIVNTVSGCDFDSPEMQEAFRRALQGTLRPEAPAKRVRKMPATVKKDLSKRKATKATARRGR